MTSTDNSTTLSAIIIIMMMMMMVMMMMMMIETSQGGKVTILWNQQVQTDRTIPNKKPDIIRDNEKETCPVC